MWGCCSVARGGGEPGLRNDQPSRVKDRWTQALWEQHSRGRACPALSETLMLVDRRSGGGAPSLLSPGSDTLR